MQIVAPGEHSLLLQADTGDGGLYPQATIFNEAGTALATVNLQDLGNNGLYKGLYTFTAGMYFVRYRVYTDSAHTVLDDRFLIDAEWLMVSTIEEDAHEASTLETAARQAQLEALRAQEPVADFGDGDPNGG